MFLGNVKRVGCSRGVSLWGWRFNASHIDGQAAFRYRYPSSYLSCLGPKPEVETHSPGTVIAAAPEFFCLFREAEGGSLPVRLDKVGESSSACVGGVSSESTKNDVVNTVGGAGGVSLSVPPGLLPSGPWLSRLRAKGVAAVEP